MKKNFLVMLLSNIPRTSSTVIIVPLIIGPYRASHPRQSRSQQYISLIGQRHIKIIEDSKKTIHHAKTSLKSLNLTTPKLIEHRNFTLIFTLMPRLSQPERG